MNIYNSPVTKIAFWVIVVGSVFCLLLPLFLPLLPLHYLKDYGEIGDAFGGISNPFVQILVPFPFNSDRLSYQANGSSFTSITTLILLLTPASFVINPRSSSFNNI